MENIEHEFLQFVAEVIQEKYEVSSEQTNKLVENSKISEMIYTAPDFVMHYDVEDWADEIMEDLSDDNLRHLTNEENEIYQKELEKKTTWSEKNIFDNDC